MLPRMFLDPKDSVLPPPGRDDLSAFRFTWCHHGLLTVYDWLDGLLTVYDCINLRHKTTTIWKFSELQQKMIACNSWQPSLKWSMLQDNSATGRRLVGDAKVYEITQVHLGLRFGRDVGTLRWSRTWGTASLRLKSVSKFEWDSDKFSWSDGRGRTDGVSSWRDPRLFGGSFITKSERHSQFGGVARMQERTEFVELWMRHYATTWK